MSESKLDEKPPIEEKQHSNSGSQNLTFKPDSSKQDTRRKSRRKYTEGSIGTFN